MTDDQILPGFATRAVAQFAAGLRFDAIPQAVLAKLKLHLLDTLGCAVAGQALDISEAARNVAARLGAGSCPVFGANTGFSPVAAAFANGVIINALDYDDGVEIDGKGLGHPSASIIPAAMVAAAETRCDGRAFLTALAAAYEVNNRLILAVQPSEARFHQVYGVAQHQTIAASIAHASIGGVDALALANTIGLAGTLTPVPSLHKYNWTTRPIISLKDMVAPAAQAGVQAALMAQAGFVGSAAILDGDTGYWRMIGSDRFDASLLLEDYQTRWFAAHGSLKLYPACRWLASALEAFEIAFNQSGLDAEAIDAVQVATFGQVATDMMVRRPVDATDAQFSLPYLIAAIAMRLPTGRAWFSTAALQCPKLHAFADKITAVTDAEMDRCMREETRRPSARVAIMDKSGATVSHFVAQPLGSESRPVSEPALVQKAMRNLVDGGVRADEIIQRVLELEREDDMRAIFRLLI